VAEEALLEVVCEVWGLWGENECETLQAAYDLVGGVVLKLQTLNALEEKDLARFMAPMGGALTIRESELLKHLRDELLDKSDELDSQIAQIIEAAVIHFRRKLKGRGKFVAWLETQSRELVRPLPERPLLDP